MTTQNIVGKAIAGFIVAVMVFVAGCASEIGKPSEPKPCGQYFDGENFRQDCNTCTCMDGKIACTKMACPPELQDKVWMKITPLQCENEWDRWLSNSSIRFVKAPTQNEVITIYLANVFGADVLDYKTVQDEGKSVIALCGSPESYTIMVQVREKDSSTLEEAGWKIVV